MIGRIILVLLLFCAVPSAYGQTTAPRIGPSRGSILLIGGGAEGAEVLQTFIKLAGGPKAMIVVIPTAGSDSTYDDDEDTAEDLRRSGARHVRVLHTRDRDVANSPAFTQAIDSAQGIWLGGGRQGRLLDAYKGTLAEQSLHAVLARGGVIAGTSAGASVMGSLVVRGSPVTNRVVIADGYTDGFGFLRATAIDQHAVARDRLLDLPDSVLARHRELLGLAIDEGAALLVQGDTARVIGRSMGFVYGYGVWRDERVPYQTLRPGDSIDINRRRPTRSARDVTGLTLAYADSVFGVHIGRSPRQATVLVARNDEVLLANSYGITLTQKMAPRTSVPTFPLGALSRVIHGVAVQLAVRDSTLMFDDVIGARGSTRVDQFLESPLAQPEAVRSLAELIGIRTETSYEAFVNSRLLAPLGMKRTRLDSATREFHSSVDELFRLEQSFRHGFPWQGSIVAVKDSTEKAMPIDGGGIWKREKFRGSDMYIVAARGSSFRSVYARIPSLGMAVIVLSNDDGFNARDVALRLLQRATRAPMVSPPS